MHRKTWLITGVSSGFGKELARQALAKDDRVTGTVRSAEKVRDLLEQYPETFSYRLLDMTDLPKVHQTVEEVFAQQGRVDVVVSNAGYGLYGAAEEFSAQELRQVVETNLMGPITFIQAALPYLRRQRSGRILQVSSVAGQVGFLGNSLYNATKFGVEGYCEALSLEMAPFHVGVTLVEPGGARTDFRYGGAKVAQNLLEAYDHAHGFLDMLDPEKGLAPGDPVKMAARMLESVETEPAPLHLMLGSRALEQTVAALRRRLENYEGQRELAASTDIVE